MAKKARDPISLAVIGGSGLYAMEGLSDVEELSVKTPFGAPSDAIVTGVLAGQRVAFLARHGQGHRLTPGEVPYRANIFALKALGVERVVSISACGSLREHLHPGDVVIPSQVYDNTKSRANTFFGRGLVAHVGVADPFCPQLSACLAEAVEQAGGTLHRGGTFVTIEGPRFSTKAESYAFRQLGFDIIGMTTSPEAYLAREAELCYAVMAHISDYDVWHESESPVTVEMVIRILNQNVQLVKLAVAAVLDKLAGASRQCECGDALATAVITCSDKVPAKLKRELAPIIGKYLPARTKA
ncbi:MAG: S-methyl-5'-thioadenosine phosphorylase [Thermoflexales bacterium]|nr:S-methyl-5'-thioadenosine phosphorylase [Thermoflexales bacterium]